MMFFAFFVWWSFDSQNNATDYLFVLKNLWALRLLHKQFMSLMILILDQANLSWKKDKISLTFKRKSKCMFQCRPVKYCLLQQYSWFSLIYRITSMIPERNLLSVHVDSLCLQHQKVWRSSFQVRVIKYFKITHEASILLLQNFLFCVPWIYMCLGEIVLIRAVLSHC